MNENEVYFAKNKFFFRNVVVKDLYYAVILKSFVQ